MLNGGNKRVFATGSIGFIGTHVVKLLNERGYVVRGYDRLNGDDILDYGMLESAVRNFKPEAIVHLAAQVFLTPSLEKPQEDALTNIIGTINVLEAARRNPCRVIFSSSGAVYGSNDRSHVNETHDPEPMSPYGVSKLSAERYCLLYNSLYEIPVVVFRFSSVYGIGRKKTSINLILDKAIKNEEITITGDGSQTRDFTYVSDVAEAVWMAVEGKFPSGIYNIGTGTSTSLNHLVTILEEKLNKRLKVKYIPKQKGDPLKNDFNVSKAEQYGFKAKITLREGIEPLIHSKP